jgi:hypothetical protein
MQANREEEARYDDSKKALYSCIIILRLSPLQLVLDKMKNFLYNFSLAVPPYHKPEFSSLDV